MIPLSQQNRRFIETSIVEQNLKSIDSINVVNEHPDPLAGYAEEPLLPLAEACAPLAKIINNLSNYVQIALNQTSDQPPDGLTIDESASIHLYTMEWNEINQSLYCMLNHALRKADRLALRPYLKYLKLFLTALVKLPCVPPQTVWRGVTANLSKNFPQGALLTWWEFSSCTTSLTVLENNMYLGNVGERTLFSIEAINGRTIRAHSHFITEDEILLLPGIYMEVQSLLNPAVGLHIIHLKQIKPMETLIELPFEGALLYPSEKNKVLWYKNKRIICELSCVLILCLIGIILGSVLGTRHSSSSSYLFLSPNSTTSTPSTQYVTCKLSFAQTLFYQTGIGPTSIGIGDFNGDNKTDLAVCSNGDNTISVFLNDGNGSLISQTPLSTDVQPESIAVGDINNDNKTDLIVCSYHINGISIFLGHGNGSFATQPTFPFASSFSIALGDFNNDNKKDVVLAIYDSNTVGILFGRGNASFGGQTTLSTGTSPLSVITADFNSDNQADLAVTNNNNSTVSMFLSYGNGSFATQILLPTGSHPTLVAANDLNGDNKTDLAVVNNDDQTVSVILGYGNGSFANQMTFPTGSHPLAIGLGDFNGDHIVDIAVGNYDNNAVSILLGYGNGTFAEQNIFLAGSRPQAIAVADFNSDHRLDLAVVNYGANNVAILLNTCQ